MNKDKIIKAEIIITFECSECHKINERILSIRKGLYRNSFREIKCKYCREDLELCLSEFVVQPRGRFYREPPF